jgi:uncharacterized protein (DUF1684 family)
MDTERLLEERRAKDSAFTGEGSPLDPGRRADFPGLDYYPPDPELRFVTELIPGDGATVQVATSDGREKTYTRVGHVEFAVGGVGCRLTVFDTGHPGLFIPFRDATSGDETYGAGRYLDVTVEGSQRVVVDFNRAYNPYCVYGDGYSCPIPPAENRLQVPIRAGERDFKENRDTMTTRGVDER